MLIIEKKVSLLLLFVGVGLLKCLVTGAPMLSSSQSQREQLAVRLKGRVLRSGGRLTGRAAVLLLPKNWKLVHLGGGGRRGNKRGRLCLLFFRGTATLVAGRHTDTQVQMEK